jgi:glycosyltransferase involved in cell wall biosynthesis
MVCGTPVVAYARGSMPEVVDEGVTGFLVQTVEQAVDAVIQAGGLDRAGCRAQARQRFGVDRMVDGYERVYKRIVEGHS